MYASCKTNNNKILNSRQKNKKKDAHERSEDWKRARRDQRKRRRQEKEYGYDVPHSS